MQRQRQDGGAATINTNVHVTLIGRHESSSGRIFSLHRITGLPGPRFFAQLV